MLAFLSISSLFLNSCTHYSKEALAARESQRSIEYPFIDQSGNIGRPVDGKPLIVRSIRGDSEYMIEIPKSAGEFDVEMPMQIQDAGKARVDYEGLRPEATDQEYALSNPKLDQTDPDRALVEGAFGLAPTDGVVQAPSLTLGMAKINDLYRSLEFDVALVEINQLLTFYPTHVRLLKMKGTVLLKLRQPELAERAWSQASELAPHDRMLRMSLDRLRERIKPDAKPQPTSDGPNPDINSTKVE